MQSKFTRLVFVFILYNYLIINETIVLFRYAVFTSWLTKASWLITRHAYLSLLVLTSCV